MYFGFAILICSLEIGVSILGCKEARAVIIKDARHNLPLSSSPFFVVQCSVCVSQSFSFHQCY